MDVATKREDAPVTSVSVQPASTKEDPLASQQLSDELSDPLKDTNKEQETKKEATKDESKSERGKQGTTVGKAEYTALLGESLGGKLYAAVSPHLTRDKLGGYAGQAVDGGMTAIGGQLTSLDPNADKDAVNKFAKALGGYSAAAAKEWMATEDGKAFAKSISSWVDTHPEWIVGIAITALAAAVLSDMPLPEVKQKIGLGSDTTLELGAKLGSIQNIAVQQLKASVKHQGGKVQSSLSVKYDAEKGTSAEATATVGSDETSVSGNVEVREDGLAIVGLRGLKKTSMGDVSGGVKSEVGKDPTFDVGVKRKDGATEASTNVSYDSEAGVLKVKDVVKTKTEGGASLQAERSTASDGSESTGLSAEGKVGEHTTASLGVSNERKADGEQSNALKASANYTKDGFSAGASGELKGNDYKLGGHLGYQDEKNKALAKYQFDSKAQTHNAEAMYQRTLNEDWKARGTVKHTSGPEGSSTSVGAHAARKLSLKDLSIIGGATHTMGPGGKGSTMGEIGVQIKNVPIMIGVDPSSGKVRVGVTIPF